MAVLSETQFAIAQNAVAGDAANRSGTGTLAALATGFGGRKIVHKDKTGQVSHTETHRYTPFGSKTQIHDSAGKLRHETKGSGNTTTILAAGLLASGSGSDLNPLLAGRLLQGQQFD